MLIPGAVVFGAYWVSWVAGAIARKREMAAGEKVLTLLSATTWLLSFAVVLFVSYTTAARPLLLGLGLLSITWLIWISGLGVGRVSVREQKIQTLVALLHLPQFALLMAVWPFINGVSLFLGMVMPFSTDGLRPLCWSFLGAWSLLGVWSLARLRSQTGKAAAGSPVLAAAESRNSALP